MRRRPAAQVAVLTALGTAIGTAVVLTVPWLPEKASAQAATIDSLYNALAVASVAILSLVTAIVVVGVANFRRRHAEGADGPPVHGHTGLEVLWTTIPAIIVTAIAVYSAAALADIERSAVGTETVTVTSQQFAWSFGYRSRHIEDAGELHLVNGRSYRFEITSKDVIHSLWVPEFRIKKDAVPGVRTLTWIKPTREGTFAVVCAELCGLGHSTMRARVVVEDQAAFDAWAAAQGGEAS